MGHLSVIVPVYNEKANLEEFVRRVHAALDGHPYTLILVDDNSPDGTGTLADELAAKMGTLKVIHRPQKMGRGTGFVDGLKAAEGDIVCIMDADLQHPPEILHEMLAAVQSGTDLVIASRYIDGGDEEGRTFSRGATSRIARWLSHLFLPQTRHVTDTQSGFFMCKRPVLEGVDLAVKGFTVLVEVLARGHYTKTREIPYTFQARAGGESKMGIGEIIRYAKQLLRLSDYRVLKFMAVGATGVVVNDGVLLLVVASGLLPALAAVVLSIEASILSNFAINNVWTFRHRKGEQFRFKLAKYHASVALGAGINFTVFSLLHAAGVSLLVANTTGILMGFTLNYLLSEKFVWKLP